MQRKYVTKKLVKRIQELTNQLFRESVVAHMDRPNPSESEINAEIAQFRMIKYGFMMAMFDAESMKNILSKKDSVDELYLRKVISLPTETLDDILFLHKHNKPQRAARTLEMINSELTRRALFQDYSESDPIKTNV